MIKRYKKSCTLLFSLLIIVSFIASGWEWENADHLLASSGSNNYHQHCTIRLQNGSILVAHYDYPSHANGGTVSSKVSHDNGATWVSGSVLWNGAVEIYGAVGCGLGISPNGTVVALFQTRTYGGETYYGMMFKRSFDNGATWTSAQDVNTTNNNATRHCSSQIVTKGNTMYAPVYTDGWAGGYRPFMIYVSTDNGSTWSKRSEVYNVSEPTEYSYCTLVPMSDDVNNGRFIWYCHFNPTRNYYKISTDNCTTWGSMTAMDTTNIRDPDINVMFEDNGTAHYFIHGRDLDYGAGHFGFWYSTDGVTWINETDVDSGTTRMAYSSGCAVGNDLLLTYSYNGDLCDLRYTWIYNVTSTSYATIEFIDINEGTNGTVIMTTMPTFNWTNISSITGYYLSGIKYRLEISNNLDFTDVVVNFSNVSSSNNFFSGYYSDNSTRISLTLHENFALESGKTYYCRATPYYIPGWG